MVRAALAVALLGGVAACTSPNDVALAARTVERPVPPLTKADTEAVAPYQDSALFNKTSRY